MKNGTAKFTYVVTYPGTYQTIRFEGTKKQALQVYRNQKAKGNRVHFSYGKAQY